MRKLFLLLLSVLSVSTGAFSQDLSNGYYRVTNAASDRYIHVLDNKGSVNVQATTADMGAIVLKKGIERAISDPASVLYVEKHGSQYDIQAQNTGIYSIIGVYVNLMKSPTVPNAYMAYGKKSSMVMYLYDAKSNMDDPESYLATKGSSRDWYINQIDNSTENYFGVQPTHQAGGKYYASFYAAFPFSFASSGMKAYYITKVDESKGVAIYKEITGTVPALTPVIIECSSDNPADNKLNLGGSGSAPTGNLGKGVMFDQHKYKHDNFVTYNKTTMRTIGLAADGSLAMTAGDYTDVPKNTFYIQVSASCPASLKLVNESDYEAGPVEATGITLSETSISLNAGEWTQIKATVTPDNATDKTVTWTSSNPAVATVDSWGTVRAIAAGTASITATCGNVSASCSVTVAATTVVATGITLSETSISLNAGEWTQIKATVTPENATDKTVTWTSSNPAVATVDNWGTVRAIAAGTASITATCGNVSASCSVTVAATTVAATGITLSETSISLNAGEFTQIKATVTPDNATDKTVTWTSSNPAVATVDSWGTVRAIAAGTATITATCGSVSASCSVTVVTPTVDATGITLSETSLSMNVGEWTQIKATVTPDNATDKTVTWSSSNPAVATVDNWGTVRAIAAGTATITATCGSVSASCSVTVITPSVDATGITLSETYLAINVGQWYQIKATVTPDNATDKTVTWSSSNPSIATVDSWGTVRAISAGTVSITASCGNVSASCDVLVMGPIVEPTGILLSHTSLSLNVGDWEQISATITPDNASVKTVAWSSSDPTVATVDKWGIVRAIADGTATITATCGNVSAACTVTVTTPVVEVTDLTLSHTSISIAIGEWAQIQAYIDPDNATDKTVTWTSSDPSIATVNSWGDVKAIAPGTATITASCGSLTASCTVTVLPIEAESITLNAEEVEITVPASYQLVATVLPDNTTDPTVTWTSSDTSVATVDANGLVQSIAEGTCTITATCGNAQAQCSVKVLPVDGIHDITADGEAFDIYNIQGIMVRSQATSLEGLPHGFYIVNGHTVRH